jgi:hypothetical protein
MVIRIVFVLVEDGNDSLNLRRPGRGFTLAPVSRERGKGEGLKHG